MALSKSVEESLTEAEANLRNALAYAARQERPLVCTQIAKLISDCLLYTSPSPRDKRQSRMPSSA